MATASSYIVYWKLQQVESTLVIDIHVEFMRSRYIFKPLMSQEIKLKVKFVINEKYLDSRNFNPKSSMCHKCNTMNCAFKRFEVVILASRKIGRAHV